MKKLILILAGALIFFAFKFETRNLGKVEQRNGLFIFAFSMPTARYQILGAINMPEIVTSNKASTNLETAIKRARKQYPECNGIMFLNDNLNKVEAIKLVE